MFESAIAMLILMFLLVLVSFVGTILLAVWTYKDAKKRDMEPVLWTLLAVFVPYYIGVIAYLVVREKHKIYNCPRCGTNVNEDYAVCPTCALPLRRQCPQCGMNCEETWRNCPRCSAEIPPVEYPFAKPQPQKSNLARNIILLILANVVLFVGIYASMLSFLVKAEVYSDESGMSFTEEYTEEFDFFQGDL